MKLQQTILPIAILLLPAIAFAHPQGHADSLMSGFSHPWLGTDHLLAMLAVGMLAATQTQFRLQLRWMLSFLASLAIGVYISIPSSLVTSTEYLVSMSVGLLGLSLLLSNKLSSWTTNGIIIASGLLHGIVHGVEIPTNTQSTSFIVGMISASVVLHLCGWIWFNWGSKRALPYFQSANGFGLTVSSLYLLFSM